MKTRIFSVILILSLLTAMFSTTAFATHETELINIPDGDTYRSVVFEYENSHHVGETIDVSLYLPDELTGICTGSFTLTFKHEFLNIQSWTFGNVLEGCDVSVDDSVTDRLTVSFTGTSAIPQANAKLLTLHVTLGMSGSAVLNIVNLSMKADSASDDTIKGLSKSASATIMILAKEDPYLETLRFAGARLSLQNNICIHFIVSEELFADGQYENPRAVFNKNGNETVVSEASRDGDYLYFICTDVAAEQMNEKIYATLYAEHNGVEFSSGVIGYSVSDYCYTQLDAIKDAKPTADNLKFRTLLVDLLNYGTAAQLYSGHRTDELVNEKLGENKTAWASSELDELHNCLHLDKTFTEPSVNWLGATLFLRESITMRFIISQTTELAGLKAVLKDSNGNTLETITSDKFELFEYDQQLYYTINYRDLNAIQMREPVSVTLYRNGVQVSQVLTYSIESYVSDAINSYSIPLLRNLVESMMKYGDSAYRYFN